jgi:Tol biopolymer transport system component
MRTWQRRMAAIALTAALVGGLAVVMAQQKPAPATAKGRSADGLLGTAQYQERVEGKIDEAIATYKKVLAAPDATSSQKARAQLHIGLCYERLGLEEARKAYEAVLEKYAGEQESANTARTRLAAMGQAKAEAATGPVISRVWEKNDYYYLSMRQDGRLVAGHDARTGDLVIKDVASGAVRRITANTKEQSDRGETAYDAVWSPDGKQFAYSWSSDAPNQLWIADVQSGSTREVKVAIAGARFSHPLDWAPDGRTLLIVVSLESPTRQALGWLSPDGKFSSVTVAPGSVFSGAVSHDGRWVAYVANSAPPNAFVVPAAGGSPRALALEKIADTIVAWTTGDDTLLLSSGRMESTGRLLQLPVTNGNPAGPPAVLREIPGLKSLGLSRSGALLYASRTPLRIDTYVAPFDLKSFTVTGPARRLNEPGDVQNSSPSWSPDGRRLAWASSDTIAWNAAIGAKVRIAAIDQGTTAAIPAPFLPLSPFMNLSWSRDGRFVLARGFRSSEPSVHRIDTTSGMVEVLMPENSPAMAAAATEKRKPGLLAVSPDGQLIYKIVPSRSTPLAIVERRLSDGTEREIERNPAWKYAGNMVISPDGSWLLLQTSVATAPTGGYVFRLELLPTAGGTARVVPGTEGAGFTFHSWAPDNRTIIFTSLPDAATGTPPVDVWRCSIDGGAPAKIGLSMPLLQEAVISPDGKRIAYTGGQPGSDEGVWLMENFLPPSKPAAKK